MFILDVNLFGQTKLVRSPFHAVRCIFWYFIVIRFAVVCCFLVIVIAMNHSATLQLARAVFVHLYYVRA